MIRFGKMIASSVGRLEPRGRRLLAGASGVSLVAAAGVILFWLSAESSRLPLLEEHSVQRLAAMQEHVVEFNNLKARTPPPALLGPSLSEAIASSLQSHRLPLSVLSLDSQRLQIKGEAGFDEVIHWIGSVQQSHRLSLVSLSAVNRREGASFDMVLTSAPE